MEYFEPLPNADIIDGLKALTAKMRQATIETEAATARYKANFDPNQPRAPAGTSNGRQWINVGYGERISTVNYQDNIVANNETYDPYAQNNPDAINSAYPIENLIGGLAAFEVRSLTHVLKTLSQSTYQRVIAAIKIRRAVRAIEDFFWRTIKKRRRQKE